MAVFFLFLRNVLLPIEILKIKILEHSDPPSQHFFVHKAFSHSFLCRRKVVLCHLAEWHTNFFSGIFMFFSFFFSLSSRNNGLSLSVILVACGMIFDRWFILPKKDHSCFSHLRGFRLSFASVLVILGTIQVGNNLCPSQFTSEWKNI